jgi:von Willebrand factor type A domain
VPSGRRSRRRRVAWLGGLVVCAVLFVAVSLSSTSWALVDNPQVIAVHTGAGSRVSMFLQTDVAAPGGELPPEELSVTIGGRAVPTTVTPLASSSLSVALVIDTSSGIEPDELEAVQSGATEFLLRLPTSAHSMVIAAGGPPRVVAPLDPGPGAALSAVSALRPDGERATAAGARLAARELAAAPPGPREIIVFSTGPDQSDASIEELDREIARAAAVTYVVQTRADDFWAQVVDRAGGSVLSSAADGVVSSYQSLAGALEDQYLVSFQTPVALPAVASVGLAAADPATSRTVVRLPEPVTEPQASDSSEATDRWGPILILLLGLALLVLLGLSLFRARRRALPNTAPDPSPPHRTAAFFERGRTSAAAEPPLATLLSRMGSHPPAPVPARDAPPPPAPAESLATATLCGEDEGVVRLRNRDGGPGAVHITGNDSGRFFGVRTLGTGVDVLNTLDPYDGVRALDWEGGQATGFKVRATGPWTIALLPVAALPTFDTSFTGTGDMVVQFTGTGSTAKITGNDRGRYFSVRTLGDIGVVRLINTMDTFSGSVSIDHGPRLFAVEAVGEWTITVT